MRREGAGSGSCSSGAVSKGAGRFPAAKVHLETQTQEHWGCSQPDWPVPGDESVCRDYTNPTCDPRIAHGGRGESSPHIYTTVRTCASPLPRIPTHRLHHTCAHTYQELTLLIQKDPKARSALLTSTVHTPHAVTCTQTQAHKAHFFHNPHTNCRLTHPERRALN